MKLIQSRKKKKTAATQKASHGLPPRIGPLYANVSGPDWSPGSGDEDEDDEV